MTDGSDVWTVEEVSDAEREAGALDPGKLERLVQRWKTHGLAVLQGVLPHTILDTMRQRLDYDAAH
eukprot:COSAG04_NODE_23322_length_340_cov_1.037344_1_plen_65_part_10